MQRRSLAFRWLGLFGVAVAAVLLVIYHQHGRGEETAVGGTVRHAVWRINDDTGQRYPDLEVLVDGGALVRVGTFGPELPQAGTRVTLRRRTIFFGSYHSYHWDGPATRAAAEPVPPLP